MSGRYQARRGNGRFTRNTPEDALGLHFNIHQLRADGVTWCGALNPSSVNQPRPDRCSQCGEYIDPARELASRESQ